MNNDHFTVNNDGGILQQKLLDHTIKKIAINKQINDILTLKYNENEEIPFELYNEIPKKLSFFNLLKFRVPIKNFIIYQYSLYAKTFVERKLLKTTKSYCCKNMISYKFKNFTFFSILTIFLVGHPFLKKYLLLLNFLGNAFLGDEYWWMKNNREIMLNFQINNHFKLGRETKEFIKFVENNGFGYLPNKNDEIYNILNSKNDKRLKVEKEKNYNIKHDEINNTFIIYDKQMNLIAEFSKHPSYYTKFFVEEIFDVKFEKDDKIVDYLTYNLDFDFHKEYLKNIYKSQNHKKNPHDLLSLIK